MKHEKYLVYEQLVCEDCLHDLGRSETKTVPRRTLRFMEKMVNLYNRLPVRRAIRCPQCGGASAKRLVSMPVAKSN